MNYGDHFNCSAPTAATTTATTTRTESGLALNYKLTRGREREWESASDTLAVSHCLHLKSIKRAFSAHSSALAPAGGVFSESAVLCLHCSCCFCVCSSCALVIALRLVLCLRCCCCCCFYSQPLRVLALLLLLSSSGLSRLSLIGSCLGVGVGACELLLLFAFFFCCSVLTRCALHLFTVVAVVVVFCAKQMAFYFIGHICALSCFVCFRLNNSIKPTSVCLQLLLSSLH